jgi:hypothetical protein
MIHRLVACLSLLAALLIAAPASAEVFHFLTNGPDGRMAVASRPASPGKNEIEAADDFLLDQATTIRHATFAGVLAGGAFPTDVAGVTIKIYRVFPQDSANPPSGNVPTRVNSPSDVVLQSRGSAAATLTFNTVSLPLSFMAANSVLNGIHPIPNQTTGGEGLTGGREVGIDVTFTSPITLPAGHYFFVPQVQMTSGEFYWLSTAHPTTSANGGTPFAGDLEGWIRNESLAPDWLRVGTDIVGGSPAPTFNFFFSLDGDSGTVATVPALSTLGLLGLALALAAAALPRLRKAA